MRMMHRKAVNHSAQDNFLACQVRWAEFLTAFEFATWEGAAPMWPSQTAGGHMAHVTWPMATCDMVHFPNPSRIIPGWKLVQRTWQAKKVFLRSEWYWLIG
jgi:hypothetical protein